MLEESITILSLKEEVEKRLLELKTKDSKGFATSIEAAIEKVGELLLPENIKKTESVLEQISLIIAELNEKNAGGQETLREIEDSLRLTQELRNNNEEDILEPPADNSDRQARIEELQTRIEERKSFKERRRVERKEKKDKAKQEYEEEIQTLNETISNLNQNLESTRSEQEIINTTKIDDMSRKKSELEANYSLANSQKDELTIKIEELEKSIQERQTNASNLTEEKSQLEAKKTQLTQERDKLKIELTQKIEAESHALREELTRLTNENEVLIQNANVVEKQIEANQSAIDQKIESIRERKSVIVNLKTETEILESSGSKIEDISSIPEVIQLENEIKELESSNLEVKRKSSDLESSNEELTTKIHELRGELDNLKQSLTRTESLEEMRLSLSKTLAMSDITKPLLSSLRHLTSCLSTSSPQRREVNKLQPRSPSPELPSALLSSLSSSHSVLRSSLVSLRSEYGISTF